MHGDSLAKRLSPILDPLQETIRSMQCRIVPSAFDSNDPTLCAFPVARDWQWTTLEAHLMQFKPQTLIVQVPSFWQVEPFAHAASRAAGAPTCIIEPQNLPLDKAAIRLASADAILAEGRDAAAIAEYLHKEHVALPPYWLLVQAGDAPSWTVSPLLRSRNTRVATEVHLAPGVPLLVQCEHISAAQSDYYHQSDFFAWNIGISASTISTTNSLLFELKDFPLPFALADKGPCACGKKLLARVS